MKLSTFYKTLGCEVVLLKLNIPYYPNRKKIHHYINTSEYDLIFCSVIFENSINYIHGDNIIFGGTGYDLENKLSEEIETQDPDYSLYPENIYSYGFITRGCIRNCYFCKVPKKEGLIHQVNTIDNIVRHRQVIFLDNNILAFQGHHEILQELINKKNKVSI